jgi:hypothetical protein
MQKPILPLVLTICLLLFLKVTIAQTPTITSFSPVSGPVGSTVIITGTGFNATAANNTVRLGAVKANISAATTTSLTITVPYGAGFQMISVLNTVSKLSGYSTSPFATIFSGCSPLNTNSLLAKADNTAGTVTRSVVFSDLDGDGKSDMIATNTGSNNISVFRNTSTIGVASFATKLDFATGVGTSGVATGDLNGDGKLDIVSSNYNSMDISIFINTTTGSTISFATKIDIPTWDIMPPSGFVNPLGVVINDMNGDGKPDIAVANFSIASVALFRNTTSGATPTFVRQLLTTSITGPRELAVGDMDGDGKSDLVVSDEAGTKVLAYRNTSPVGVAFTFDSPVIGVTGTAPRGVSLGDLDQDGKLDIAVVNSGSASVSVFRNTSTSGSISISSKTDFTSGTSPREVVLADVDGDGKLEMAASSNTPASSSLRIFRNTSTSGFISFAANVTFPAGNNALGVALEDVDNDGKVDAAVTSSSTGTVGIFKNISPVSTISGIAPATVTTTSVCDNGTWQTLYDPGSNGVLAAIKYNGNNLGTITGSVYVEALPGTIISTGERYLARHFVIKPSTQPSTAVQVRLYFTNAELLAFKAVNPIVQSLSDLSITKYDGPNEDGVYNPSTGTTALITLSAITTGFEHGAHYLEFTTSSFSEFWIHTGFVILPVNLTSFTADKKANKTLLKWTTSSEQNSDRFIVERSADALNYTAIGSVAAAGNSNKINNYSYYDLSPLNGKNFYRLQLVDRGGRKTESKVVMVNQTAADNITVTLAYQSAKQVQVTISGKVNNGSFIIHDGNGRKVKTYRISTSDAGTVLNIDLTNFASGIYAYQLVTGQGNVSNGKILLR